MEVYTERGEAKLRVTDVAISKQIQGAVLQTLYLKVNSCCSICQGHYTEIAELILKVQQWFTYS